jgi:hypothetical protein
MGLGVEGANTLASKITELFGIGVDGPCAIELIMVVEIAAQFVAFGKAYGHSPDCTT